MNLFKYLSNGVTKKGYNINNCYNSLVNEFKKGNITYPRSDGYFHDEISILNMDNINPEVKELLFMKNKWPILKEKEIIGDFFTLANYFYLATPASIVNDYNKIKKENIKPKKDKIDLFIGIQLKKEYEENNHFIKVKNFNFENFLKNIKDNKIKKVKISKELNDLLIA